MINPTFEENLKEYCLTLDSDLYEEKIYLPLTYMARSICEKRGVEDRDYSDGIVEDMVSHVTVKLPEYYCPDKGTCKATVYVLMDQYLVRKQMRDSCQKRDRKKIIYIEEMPGEENGICKLMEIDVDEMKLMKSLLLEHRDIFRSMRGMKKRKIVDTIIDAICNPNEYKTNPDACISSYVKDIAGRCKVNRTTVQRVLKEMRVLWKSNGVSLAEEINSVLPLVQ
jgi:hypothetical protein